MATVYRDAKNQGVFTTVAAVLKRNPDSPVIQLWGRKLLSMVEMTGANETAAASDKRTKKEVEQFMQQKKIGQQRKKKGASIEVLE